MVECLYFTLDPIDERYGPSPNYSFQQQPSAGPGCLETIVGNRGNNVIPAEYRVDVLLTEFRTQSSGHSI